MKFELKETRSCERVLEFEIPRAEVEKKSKSYYKELQREALIPGFRKGKVPIAILRKRFGKDIDAEIVQELMQDAIKEGLEEYSDMKILGSPTIDNINSEEGKPMTFSVTLEIMPEFELCECKGIPISLSVLHEEAMVETMLERIRHDAADLVPVDDEPAEEGDFLIIKYVLRNEEGGVSESEDDFQFMLGSNEVNPEFNVQLKGTKVDDVRTFPIEYGEDYENEELRGKSFQFEVEILEVKRKELPELDDDLAINTSGYESLDELKKELLDYAKDQQQKTILESSEQQITDYLLKNNSFDLSDRMISEHSKFVRENVEKQLENLSRGEDINEKTIDTITRVRAINELSRYLIFQRIVESENLAVTPHDIDTYLEEVAISQDQEPRQFVRELRKNEDSIESIEHTLLQEKIIAFLTDHANIEIKKLNQQEYQEHLMKRVAQSEKSLEVKKDSEPSTDNQIIEEEVTE